MTDELSPELQRVARTADRSMGIVYALLGLMTLLVPFEPVWPRLLTIPALVATVYLASRATRPIPTPVAAAALAVGLVTAIGCGLFNLSPFGSLGLSACGGVVISQLPRNRWLWAGVVVLASVGSGALVWFGNPALTGEFVAIALVFSGTNMFGSLQTAKNWEVSLQADARQRAEKDLAIARERFRFAADLHDVQGHTLHVVKLKAALAERLVRTDPEQAEDELRQIRALIAETITQTREIANAERRLTLAGEVANAESLLRATGAEVRVSREGDPPRELEEPIGLVLREATTNILRHAAATQVRIDVAPAAIVIANDGAPAGRDEPQLGGLAVLRERLDQWGGTLDVAQDGPWFTTRARFAPAGAG